MELEKKINDADVIWKKTKKYLVNNAVISRKSNSMLQHSSANSSSSSREK